LYVAANLVQAHEGETVRLKLKEKSNELEAEKKKVKELLEKVKGMETETQGVQKILKEKEGKLYTEDVSIMSLTYISNLSMCACRSNSLFESHGEGFTNEVFSSGRREE
jgi:hypothetical protein